MCGIKKSNISVCVFMVVYHRDTALVHCIAVLLLSFYICPYCMTHFNICKHMFTCRICILLCERMFKVPCEVFRSEEPFGTSAQHDTEEPQSPFVTCHSRKSKGVTNLMSTKAQFHQVSHDTEKAQRKIGA